MSQTSQSDNSSSAGSSDGQLVALFLANQARIYTFIVSLVPNRADAEDLLQETGIVLHSRFREFQPGSSFLAWACRIAYHKVLDFRKRQSRSRVQFDTEFVEAIAMHQLADEASIAARHLALMKCLERLSSRDRALVERCYHPHVTAKSVADELRRPVDTVYKNLRRIRRILFDCVGRSLAMEERA